MFLGGASAVSHRVLVEEVGVQLAAYVELSGENNILTPAAKFVPGTAYHWRVDAVAANGAVVVGDEWTFTAHCDDPDCADCGASTESGSCVACSSGSLMSGRCVLYGGCVDGSWDVNTTAAKYSPNACAFEEDSLICIHNGIGGYYSDNFTVAGEVVDGCSGADYLKAKLYQNGVTVDGYNSLSCFSQDYDVTAVFECHQCDAGMIHDPTAAAGCAFPVVETSVPDGGCVDGSWDVNTTAAKYSPNACAFEEDSLICIHNGIEGNYTDDFTVEGVLVTGCVGADYLKAKLLRNGVEVSGYNSLSCFSQEYDVLAVFECRQCAYGMLLDPTAASGCADDPDIDGDYFDDDDEGDEDEDEEFSEGDGAAVAMGCGVGVLVGLVVHQHNKLKKLALGVKPPGDAPKSATLTTKADAPSVRVDEV